MSFAYYQGQEADALTYYQRMMERQADPAIRKELSELIEKLQKIVKEKHESLAPVGTEMQNSVWQTV